jgi:FkbM family methyltransferase
MTVQVQTNKILIENRIGRKFWVFDSDSFYTQRLQAGPYQKQNLLHLRKLCPNPNTVLDIGMNIGMNTIEYATWAKRVIGFEPVPTTYQVALDNIAMNQKEYNSELGWWKEDDKWASLEVVGNIETHNVALGPDRKTIEMHIKKNDGHNRVANDNGDFKTVNGKDIKRNTGYPRVTIQQEVLDGYAFDNVDVIKIDVEGYELLVLEGATDTIDRNRPIVQIECVEIQPRAFGRTMQELLDYFADRDYIITTADGKVQPFEFQHVPRMMDRFMIPRERTDLYDPKQLGALHYAD